MTQVIPHMHRKSLNRLMSDSATSDSVLTTKSVPLNTEFPVVYVAGIFFSLQLFLGAIKKSLQPKS